MTFQKSDFERISNINKSTCFSFYMPTHIKGKEVREGQDRILFKNQIQKIKSHLEDEDKKPGEINKYLAPLNELLEDHNFWEHQSNSLAVFVTEDFVKHFRVPMEIDETFVVDDQFYLKPLAPLVSGESHSIWVFAVSLEKARFLPSLPGAH